MRVGHAFLQTFVAQVIQSFASILTGVLIARELGPAGQGQYAVLLAATALLATIAAAGQFEGNVLASAGRASFGRVLLVRSAIQAVLAGMLVLVSQPLWRNAGGGMYASASGIMALILTFETLALLFRGINLGQHQITTYNLVTLAQRMVYLSCVALLIWAHELRLQTVLLAWLAAAAMNILLNGALIWRHSTLEAITIRNVLKGWRTALQTGVRALVTIVLTLLLIRVDIYMLGPFLGVDSVGQMSVATTLAEYLWYVPSILGSMLFAAVAADRSPEIVGKVSRSTRTLVGLLAPISIVLILVGRAAVPWIYGDAYLQAGMLFAALVPGMFALAIHLVLDSYFSGSGFPPVSYIAAGAALTLKIGLNLVMIPRFGTLGAAFATSAVYTLLLLTKVVVFHRRTGVPLSDILRMRASDIRSAVVTARGWVGPLGRT